MHITLASGWRNDRALGLWLSEAVDMRRGWDDLLYSGHEGLITLDFKIAEALMRFFKEDNKSNSAQKLAILSIEQDERIGLVPRGRQMINHVYRELHADLYTSDASNIITLMKV